MNYQTLYRMNTTNRKKKPNLYYLYSALCCTFSSCCRLPTADCRLLNKVWSGGLFYTDIFPLIGTRRRHKHWIYPYRNPVALGTMIHFVEWFLQSGKVPYNNLQAQGMRGIGGDALRLSNVTTY